MDALSKERQLAACTLAAGCIGIGFVLGSTLRWRQVYPWGRQQVLSGEEQGHEKQKSGEELSGRTAQHADLEFVAAEHNGLSSNISFRVGSAIVRRTVICGDALAWLEQQTELPGSVITSMPDITELSFLSLSVKEYSDWFRDTAQLLLEKTPTDGVVVFYQTDLRKDGVWVDKSALCSAAAAAVGASLLFHKIVCAAPPESFEKSIPRPRYSHLLAFSKGLRDDLRESSPDVLADRGHMPWDRAMGVRACLLACTYLRKTCPEHRRVVVDPFCGHGTILAVANLLGLESLGVERNKARCRSARNLTLEKIECTPEWYS
eukprot:TRINITY_DN36807_c0_g2_i1.p1 TRINITY_DN36807_c0_g2~~TRINITY_DN36807_c0_g2_i1.p1  ORF type:complete len:319 (+),score=35.94 TRINITY_DN36807_c0_g2_i1:16-972(+)